MYRTALRSSTGALRSVRPSTFSSAPRRLLSTAPAARKRTWKGAGLRWGLAIAAVYFYNTSPIFADELPPQAGPAPVPFSNSDLPTIDALIEEKRRTTPAVAPPPAPQEAPKTPEVAAAAATEAETAVPEVENPELGPLDQGGAFNPETGEINWDCPCLGGMAHGPCGEEFKAAFSCFVFSTEEPKGMECIDKFQGMQDCFRKHPEIYGTEISEMGDDEAEDAATAPSDAALAEDAPKSLPVEETSPRKPETATELVKVETAPATEPKAAQPEAAQPEEPKDSTKEPEIPAKAHDATEANKTKDQ